MYYLMLKLNKCYVMLLKLFMPLEIDVQYSGSYYEKKKNKKKIVFLRTIHKLLL